MTAVRCDGYARREQPLDEDDTSRCDARSSDNEDILLVTTGDEQGKDHWLGASVSIDMGCALDRDALMYSPMGSDFFIEASNLPYRFMCFLSGPFSVYKRYSI